MVIENGIIPFPCIPKTTVVIRAIKTPENSKEWQYGNGRINSCNDKEACMSKGVDSKKEVKKEPAKTPKEKKADKKIKKAEKKK